MAPADGGSAPPPPAREHDATTLAAPASSADATAASTEDAAGTSLSRCMDFPGIRIIDLDATELPSNNREILEVAIEWMFADPSILDAIMSVPLMPHQDEGTGGLAPPVVPVATEGVLGESTADTELVVIEPSPTSAGQSMDAPCSSPQKQLWTRPLLRWSTVAPACCHRRRGGPRAKPTRHGPLGTRRP
jgi:hypothetical protein